MKMTKGLNGTAIKIIAVVFMVADHIHQMFISFGAPIWLTYLGRPVFPMFLFTSAEAFHYTTNRKKYLQRLLYASWAMTILSVTIQFILPNENVVLMNNAFTTFFLAGLYMLFWDRFVEGIKEKKASKVLTSILLSLLPILSAIPALLAVQLTEELPFPVARGLITLSMLIPNMLMVEGGFFMVMLGVAFYLFYPAHIFLLYIIATILS